VVICEYKFLHGCKRFQLQPKELDKDGKVQKSEVFDEPQLALVKKRAAEGTSNTGGPRPEPSRAEPPTGR
jgi:hypothetical protein